MRVRVYDNRKTTQDLINEERALLDSDFNARLKNAEESMKAIYPEEYKKIRSRYFGNGNNLGLIGSQYNYIHDMITRRSDDQMKKYYNELNDYFIKQTGTQPGYMLPGVDINEEAPDFNALRQKDIDRFYSPTENSDYLNSVEKQNAKNAYWALQNKNADGTFDHDGYFDYDPNNGLLNTEANYARATGSYNYTPKEREAAATWERAQNSPIVTAMEFSPLFPVVAGAKAAIASSAQDASAGDVAMNAAFAALPAVSKYAYDMYKINKNTLKTIPNLKRIIPESGELNVGSETAGLDKRGDLSFMAYFNMSPRQVMEQIEKDKSLIDVGKKFKVNSLSTDSYPLVLHTMTTKKSPNFNVLYNGKTMQLNNFGNLKGEAAVNRINKKITELNKDRKLAIPLAKLESRPMHQNIEDFYINNEGVAAQIIRNNFKTLDDFKNAYKQSNDVKNLVDGIINSSTERNITVPYLEAIRMYNHGGVLDDTYREQIERIRQPRFAGWRFKDGGIYIKEENRGKFTEQAQRAGMTTKQFTSEVLENPNKYSPTTVKRARFSRNIGGN